MEDEDALGVRRDGEGGGDVERASTSATASRTREERCIDVLLGCC